MYAETKGSDFQFELKEAGDVMSITGYGSTFGGKPDSYGDIVAAGAFIDSLKARMPKMLYQHDTTRICGIWDVAEENDKGLYLEGRFLPTTLGRDAYEEAKSKALDTMSIGFRTRKASYDEDQEIRTLEQLDLFEVSLVTFPANENAVVTGVKAPHTARGLEKILRDAGFSHKEAKAIVAGGIKAIDGQRDADPDFDAAMTIFKTISNPIHS